MPDSDPESVHAQNFPTATEHDGQGNWVFSSRRSHGPLHRSLANPEIVKTICALLVALLCLRRTPVVRTFFVFWNTAF